MFALLKEVLRLQEWYYWVAFSFALLVGFVPPAIPTKHLEKLFKVFLFGVVSALVLIPLQYLFYDKFMDHGESHVAALAALAWRGQELYPGPNSIYNYGNFYGPFSYFYFGIPLFFSKTFFAMKLPAIINPLLSAVLLYTAIKRTNGKEYAFAWTVLCFVVAAFFGPTYYWIRPDSLAFLLLCAAVFTLTLEKQTHRLIGSSVLLALGLNLKVQIGIHFFPIFWLLMQSCGFARTFLAGVFGIALSLLPYLLPNLSLKNFFYILTAAIDQKEHASPISHYIVFAMIYLFPAFLKTKLARFDAKTVSTLVIFMIAGIFCCVIAIKPGSGFYQILPLTVPLFFWTANIPREVSSVFKQESYSFRNRITIALLVSYFLGFALLSIAPQYMGIKMARGNAKLAVVDDLKAIENKYTQHKIAIGWGDDRTNGDYYHFSWYRGYFVWKGHPYYMDLGIQMDMDLIGRKPPPELNQVFSNCLVDLWLIPKGERPFELKGWMTREILYSQEFLDLFWKKHTKIDQSAFYDVWQCNQN